MKMEETNDGQKFGSEIWLRIQADGAGILYEEKNIVSEISLSIDALEDILEFNKKIGREKDIAEWVEMDDFYDKPNPDWVDFIKKYGYNPKKSYELFMVNVQDEYLLIPENLFYEE